MASFIQKKNLAKSLDISKKILTIEGIKDYIQEKISVEDSISGL
jgi:hypothetical protein